MASTSDVPIPSSYWVRPQQLLAGEYPGARKETEARAKVRLFLNSGIRYFMDLTCDNELLPYAPLLEAESATLSAPGEHRRFPIRDFGTPTPEQMSGILDALDAALGKNLAVYVHCWGGIGRTGTVIGCHLVRHGFSGRKALDEIARLREKIPFSDRLRRSPETEAQRQMVLGWEAGK